MTGKALHNLSPVLLSKGIMCLSYPGGAHALATLAHLLFLKHANFRPSCLLMAPHAIFSFSFLKDFFHSSNLSLNISSLDDLFPCHQFRGPPHLPVTHTPHCHAYSYQIYHTSENLVRSCVSFLVYCAPHSLVNL